MGRNGFRGENGRGRITKERDFFLFYTRPGLI